MLVGYARVLTAGDLRGVLFRDNMDPFLLPKGNKRDRNIR